MYGRREFWGCPWLERDFGSSEYYYPYNMHLANTVKAWRDRAPNMNGFYCLSWRLTDAVEPKMSFLASAPWDSADRFPDGPGGLPRLRRPQLWPGRRRGDRRHPRQQRALCQRLWRMLRHAAVPSHSGP